MIPDGTIPVLDHGFVRLDGAMADDLSVVNGVPAPLDDAVVRIGDEELYEPRCEECWVAERERAPSGTGPTVGRR